MAGELAEEAWDSGLYYDKCNNYDETTQWMSKDGTIYEIKDMKLSHIKNVTNMLKRKNIDVPRAMRIILANNK